MTGTAVGTDAAADADTGIRGATGTGASMGDVDGADAAADADTGTGGAIGTGAALGGVDATGTKAGAAARMAKGAGVARGAGAAIGTGAATRDGAVCAARSKNRGTCEPWCCDKRRMASARRATMRSSDRRLRARRCHAGSLPSLRGRTRGGCMPRLG